MGTNTAEPRTIESASCSSSKTYSESDGELVCDEICLLPCPLPRPLALAPGSTWLPLLLSPAGWKQHGLSTKPTPIRSQPVCNPVNESKGAQIVNLQRELDRALFQIPFGVFVSEFLSPASLKSETLGPTSEACYTLWQ